MASPTPKKSSEVEAVSNSPDSRTISSKKSPWKNVPPICLLFFFNAWKSTTSTCVKHNPPSGRHRRSNAETCHELSTPGLGVVCDPGHSVSWSLEFAALVHHPTGWGTFHGQGRTVLGWKELRAISTTKRSFFETFLAPSKLGEDDQMILFQSDGSTTNWNRYKTLTVAEAAERHRT